MKVTHRQYLTIPLDAGERKRVEVESPAEDAHGWIFRWGGTLEVAMFRRGQVKASLHDGDHKVGDLRNGFFGLECKTPGQIKDDPRFGSAFWKDPNTYHEVKAGHKHELEFFNTSTRPIEYKLLVEVREYDTD